MDFLKDIGGTIEPLMEDDGFLELTRKTASNLLTHGLRAAATAGTRNPIFKAAEVATAPTEDLEQRLALQPYPYDRGRLVRDTAVRVGGLANSLTGGLVGMGMGLMGKAQPLVDQMYSSDVQHPQAPQPEGLRQRHQDLYPPIIGVRG